MPRSIPPVASMPSIIPPCCCFSALACTLAAYYTPSTLLFLSLCPCVHRPPSIPPWRRTAAAIDAATVLTAPRYHPPLPSLSRAHGRCRSSQCPASPQASPRAAAAAPSSRSALSPSIVPPPQRHAAVDASVDAAVVRSAQKQRSRSSSSRAAEQRSRSSRLFPPRRSADNIIILCRIVGLRMFGVGGNS